MDKLESLAEAEELLGKERLNDLKSFVPEEGILEWMNSKCDWFDGKTPYEVIKKYGNFEAIDQLIEHTRTGGYL